MTWVVEAFFWLPAKLVELVIKRLHGDGILGMVDNAMTGVKRRCLLAVGINGTVRCSASCIVYDKGFGNLNTQRKGH